MIKQNRLRHTQEILRNIKRHVYPLSVLLVSISFLHTAFLSPTINYPYLFLGIFCLLLALVEVLMNPYWKIAEVIYTFTYFFLVAFFCAHFGRIIFGVLYGNGPLSVLIESFVWVPGIYMATVVFYPRRRGLYYAWGIFFLTLLIGLVQIVLAEPSLAVIRAFSDFYLANLTFLLFLYLFVYMHQAFDEARAFAEIQEKLAESDEITGLPNRRYLQEYLQQLIDKAKWGEQKLSIGLCAPKYTSQSRYGYTQESTDTLLKDLAGTLSKNLDGAVLGRWNAESLIIIWQDNLENAINAGKELVKSCEITPEGSQGSIKTILGIASFLPNDDIVLLTKRAGRALDRANEDKSSGVETAQGPLGLRVSEK